MVNESNKSLINKSLINKSLINESLVNESLINESMILDENNKHEELRSRTLIGSNILYDIDIKPDSKRTFTGKIYNPEEGKSYNSKIRQLDNG